MMCSVRRLFASLLLGVGLAVASLTLSGWWVQHTILDPSRTGDVVGSVLDEPEVRDAVAESLARAVATQAGVPAAEVSALARTQLQALPDRAFLGQFVEDAHARLVGEATGPVELDAAQLAPLLGDQLAQQVGPVTWSVPTYSPLETARDRLDGLVATGLVVAIGFVTAGFLLHPRRDHALRTVGGWALAACLWQLVIAWLIPVVVLPEVTDNPWVGIASGVARARMAPLVATLLVLAGAGVACLVASLALAPRRRRRTASPAEPPGGGHAPATAGARRSPPRPVGADPAPMEWPSTRQTRSQWKASFSDSHRRPADGRDPDAEDDWML
jgi:hypothetical protein